MKAFIRKNLIVLFLLTYFIPSFSFAANIFFDSNQSNYSNNEDFLVQVFLDTETKKVNAIEGVILFPNNQLGLKEIRDGNSSVNFWIKKPILSADGKIDFSGITTGGFSGSKILLFGIIFHSKKIGNGILDFESIQILENDGVGTKIITKNIPFNFSIIGESRDKNKEDLIIKDSFPPEDFRPLVASDPNIFNGKNFIVFSTVDKGVGIDHYEIRESFWGLGEKYVQAESPYVLKDQKLKSNIYIKAVDNDGNIKIVKVNAQNKIAVLEQWLIVCALLLVCIFLLFRKTIWLKFFIK